MSPGMSARSKVLPVRRPTLVLLFSAVFAIREFNDNDKDDSRLRVTPSMMNATEESNGEGDAAIDGPSGSKKASKKSKLDKDSVQAGVEGALGIFKAGKEIADGKADIGTAGSLISSVGALVPFVVPPPAGLIAGGVLGLAGGILSACKEEDPSNQDVIDKMTEGFNQVQEKLSLMGLKLDSMQSQLGRMEGLLHDIKRRLEKVHQQMQWQFEFHLGRLGKMNAAFFHIQDLIKETQQDSSYGIKLGRAAASYAAKYASERYGTSSLSPANVRAVVSQTTDVCEARELYNQILATRFELLLIQLLASRLGSEDLPETTRTRSTVKALEDLNTDLADYKREIEHHYGTSIKSVLRQWEAPSKAACSTLDDIYVIGTSGRVYSQTLSTMTPDTDWHLLTDKGAVTSIAVVGDTMYGVGISKRVFTQTLSTMTQDTEWTLLAGKGSVTSIAIVGDTMYGIGISRGVWMQTLSTMTPDTEWTLVGKCCVTSFTIVGDTMYGIGTSGRVYSQTLSTMTPDTDWHLLTDKGAVTSIAVVGDTMYGVGISKRVFTQTLSTMTQDTEWTLLAGKGSVTSIAIVGDTMYGIGISRGVWMQTLSTMTPDTEWTLVGKCCVTSFTIVGDTMYGIGTSGRVYSQTLS
eukprot:CAMPEP_0115416530 /NCGR_PEP_ID=MMETSP0271-20121206/23661_1 /TAXON_ID=71861 /ORGANISM="Scrippsiella trochoidea, Strain CCMP3099" /LENGTH=634 /DNA_ID=CAMNT_0002840899 /DNA_START=60 /DNA_END=1961 /DNA_ORIENTATION=+